jgi:deoxyxylulose-5-phosphate synthase
MNTKALRDIFGLELVNFAKKNKKILAISPDLKQATKLSYFFKEFPERSYEVGIAEANAVGIAAGLAMSGFRPVLASFGSFLTGKNVEIRTSIAFNKAPVILVGTHGGLIGQDGPTQAGLQDIAVMRSIPNVKVIQPSTPIEMKEALRVILKSKDIIYLRVSREATKEFFNDNHKFQIGKINIIHTNEEFNNYLIKKINNRKYHYLEQYKYIDNKYKIHIIKYENLNKELDDLYKKYNININLTDKKINSREETNKNILFEISDFNRELINLINTIYDKDFTMFNYSKITPN